MDEEAQLIEFHIWSKQILPNNSVDKITLVVKDIITNITKEKMIEDHVLDIGTTGKLTIKIHFLPTLT